MVNAFTSRVLCLFCLISFLMSTKNALASASAVYVTVRESKLHAKADFFSPATGDIKYGDRLDVSSEQGSWMQVRTSSGKTGYVHTSAISERKVVLKSSATFSGGGADQSDVVLAGKGFSADVEKEFAATHQNLNFSDVNAMERIRISPKELSMFAQQGRLGGGWK